MNVHKNLLTCGDIMVKSDIGEGGNGSKKRKEKRANAFY